MSSARDSRRLLKIDWYGVGRRIRQLRGFNLSQEHFSVRVGVSQAYLSKMERGKVEAGAEVLLNIAREFRTTIEWLLIGEDRLP